MMGTRRILVFGFLAVALVGVGSAAAAHGSSRLVAGDGSMHTITVTVLSGEGDGATAPAGDRSTLLAHTHSHADGHTEHHEVPGTSDDTVESHPFLAHDAAPNGVVLVWTRGGDGASDVVVSRFDGERWSEPVLVTDAPGKVGQARAVVQASGATRVFWAAGDPDSPQFLTRRLDTDLDPAGPTEPVGAGEGLDLDGDGGRTEAPFDDDLHVIFHESLGGRERMVLFGVRDVPTPIGTITTRLDLVLPADASELSEPRVTSVNGRLFVRIVADGDLLYTAQTDAYSWTEYRRVPLDSGPREAAELLLIEEMLSPER